MRSVGVAFTCMLTLLASTAADVSAQPSSAAKPPAAPAPAAAPAAAAAPAPAPAPAPTPAATASAPAATPSSAPAAPATSAPPLYYVEPSTPSPEPGQPEIFEPQPPMYGFESPPPPPPPNAPANTALWVGVRAGALLPFGALWVDGFNGYYHQRSFTDYASIGPVFELDLGARLAQRYQVFALWEHAALGTGSLDRNAFGGQKWGATNLYGIGLRFSTDPTSIGFVAEIGLGYRDFRAYWQDGTKLSMTEGWFDARIGLGAEFRLSKWLSLDPMVVLGGGSFDSAKWSGPGKSGNALTTYDSGGGYGTVSFVLGAHADVL